VRWIESKRSLPRKKNLREAAMHNHQRMVFVVYWIKPDHPVSVIGVYDDYRDAQDKQAEQPEQFAVQIVPYFPSRPIEP